MVEAIDIKTFKQALGKLDKSATKAAAHLNILQQEHIGLIMALSDLRRYARQLAEDAYEGEDLAIAQRRIAQICAVLSKHEDA